jgi:hypothetical protein
MTEYELLSAYNETAEAISTNFQFWLSVTFGLIIVADLPNIKLSKVMGRLLLTLYVCLSVLFTIRLYTTGALNDGLRNALIDMGSSVHVVSELTNNLFAVLFLVVMISGTLGTTILVIRASRSKHMEDKRLDTVT